MYYFGNMDFSSSSFSYVAIIFDVIWLHAY